MWKTLFIGFCLYLNSQAAFGLHLSYEIPSKNKSFEILPSPLSVWKQSEKTSFKKTNYGNRIEPELQSVLNFTNEDLNAVQISKTDSLEVTSEKNSPKYIYIQTHGDSVFYPLRSNYLFFVPIQEEQESVQIQLSSLQFESTNEGTDELHYHFFIADDSIPIFTSSDIQTERGDDLQDSLSLYTRHDQTFKINEETQPGLRKRSAYGQELPLQAGYIFSFCIVFKDQPARDFIQKEGECYTYSLAEKDSLLPLIPGKRLRSAGVSSQFLYLIERHERQRNSDIWKKTWTKVNVPSGQAVSLKESQWQKLAH